MNNMKVIISDDDSEFCKAEAIELYNKIINPYG